MESWSKHQVGAFAVKDGVPRCFFRGGNQGEDRGAPGLENERLEPKNGGLVQMMFLFNWTISCFHVNIQGCIYTP